MLAWVIILFHIVGFTPSGLGSWSAGIDLRRYSIQAYGSISPVFLDSNQATWFEQASADPVYGVFFGMFSILTGAKTLQDGLWNLDWVQPALLLYGLAALASAKFFEANFERKVPRSLTLLLPVLFILPVGRIHVLLYGFAGNALAPALLMLILLLLIKSMLAAHADWRNVLLVLLLSLALVNTYHTWSTYFAIVCVVSATWILLRERGLHTAGRPVARIMTIVPALWMFTALYLGNGPLFSRFVDAITVLRTYRPAILSIGIYDPSTAGPLAPYLRGFPILSFENLVVRLLLVLFALTVCWFAVKLSRVPKPVRDAHSEVDLALGLAISSAAAVAALAALGGANLAIERGFELLGVTGPFILALGLPFAVHDPNTIGIRQRPTRRREPISPGRGIVRLSLIAIVLLLIATSFQAIAVPSKDELLSDSEITSLGTLSRLAGATQTLWSDDRLASGFLYFEGTRFVTFDVKYNSSEAAKAALALFYEGSCKAGIQYLHDTGATIAVVSLYMADVGVVLRTGRFNPATKVESCLDASGSRFFDSGSVIAYSFDTSP